MKKLFIPMLVLIAAVLLESCSSGKKAFESGNYDAAVIKAISRLRKSPNNKKASQTLRESYPLTIKWHRDNVQQAKLSNNEFKWERVVQEYQQVNYLYGELQRCPACLPLVVRPVHYVTELNEARNQAAAIRYHKGDQLLVRARENHDLYEAREAYQHFEVASQLLGDYKDVRDKMAEAKFLATLKVVVEPIPMHSRNLQISNEFFENKILEFLETMPVNEFVRFYSYEEAKNIGLTEPDQIIQIQFDDFVLGQTYLKEKEIQMSRDSVVLAIIKASNDQADDYALAVNSSAQDAISFLKYQPVVGPLWEDHDVATGNEKKVTICHKVPASLGVTNTITVSQNALQHHLDHGDVQGPCNGDEDPQANQGQTPSDQKEDNGQVGSTDTGNSGNQGSSTSGSQGGNSQGTAGQGTYTQGTNTEGGTQNTGTQGTYTQGTNTQGGSTASGSSSGQNPTQQQGETVSQEPVSTKVYGTVKATVHVFHKSLSSHGVMDFKIIDVHSQRVLTQEKMPGEFVWFTEWGYFNGDERALDDYFLDIVKLKEAHPPAPQDLFVAFTQPIYNQITWKIREFYRNY